MTAVWVGVDPGYNATGLVVRKGPDLLWWDVVKRRASEAVVPGDQGIEVGPCYLSDVLDVVRTAIHKAEASAWSSGTARVRVAVEDVKAPSVHMKNRDGETQMRAKPRYILGAAKVVGAVEAYVHGRDGVDLVRVAPSRHGRQPLTTYPADLVTARERQHGLNRAAQHGADVNHCRSAWDIAGSGPAAARIAIALDITRAQLARHRPQGDPK